MATVGLCSGSTPTPTWSRPPTWTAAGGGLCLTRTWWTPGPSSLSRPLGNSISSSVCRKQTLWDCTLFEVLHWSIWASTTVMSYQKWTQVVFRHHEIQHGQLQTDYESTSPGLDLFVHYKLFLKLFLLSLLSRHGWLINVLLSVKTKHVS